MLGGRAEEKIRDNSNYFTSFLFPMPTYPILRETVHCLPTKCMIVYQCDISIQKDKGIKNKCLDLLKFSYPSAFHIIAQ